MSDLTIISVDNDNVAELGFFCVKNKKHVGYIAKLAWLHDRFKEGLRIKADAKPADIFSIFMWGESVKLKNLTADN